MSLSRSVGVLTSLSLSLSSLRWEIVWRSLSLSLISQRFWPLSRFRFEWFERPNLSPRGVCPRGESERFDFSLSLSLSHTADSHLSLSWKSFSLSLSWWLQLIVSVAISLWCLWVAVTSGVTSLSLVTFLWRPVTSCDVFYRIVSNYF